jgi:AraC-like DNA-binding protein
MASPPTNSYAVAQPISAEEAVAENSPSPAEPGRIWKARRFIREHFCDDEFSHQLVASEVRMNATYLSERFKESTGVTFTSWVAILRVKRACELLTTSTLPVTDVAFEAGFHSLSQFNRTFRRLRGESPREFRLSHRKIENTTRLLV